MPEPKHLQGVPRHELVARILQLEAELDEQRRVTVRVLFGSGDRAVIHTIYGEVHVCSKPRHVAALWWGEEIAARLYPGETEV